MSGWGVQAGRWVGCAFWIVLTLAPPAALPAGAQGTADDYARSAAVGELLSDRVVGVAGDPNWIDGGPSFWYRVSVPGGDRFVRVNPTVPEKAPAFDHERLASSLSQATGSEHSAISLPFDAFDYIGAGGEIEFELDDFLWRCELTGYQCLRGEEVQAGGGGGRGGGRGGGGGFGGFGGQGQEDVRTSPDGRYEALIRNFNIAVREAGEREVRMLTTDGSEGNAYGFNSVRWSPDSRKIAAYRTIPGYERIVHYIRSSPDEQIQPIHEERVYTKPGDVLDVDQPVIVHVETGRQIAVDDLLFPNAYNMTGLTWREDSEHLTFEYNARGHQVYRVVEVNAETGATRAVIFEEEDTFFQYRAANGNQRDQGTRYRYELNDGEEIIWMSERDGWKQLYLYDGNTGRVKNRITNGEWVVNAVDRVDEENRQIWFRANGVDPDQDPYFVHYYRIDFDGSNLTTFTDADGMHEVEWSPDGDYYVDSWSRVDLPPVSVVRRTSDQAVVLELERADASALMEVGWQYPEVFSAKGRDGETDIWGIIVRPLNFDPDRDYPVIESIYAGPQGSFVPKTFGTQTGFQSIAELGFIVVQIDGMGTANRSKAFHDVAWKNLGDAGFPDRILWHQAVAAQYDYYDISRVGIYGTSAGGQNSLGGLLFHPEFYDVAVSAAGSHDNRMDKIWWNELWMGWPLGEQYSTSSNVDNAWRLQGKLLLIVGEMDTNVDPSTTLQVVDRLIDADKYFDLLFLPGAGHTSGGGYGNLKRNDFFVQHLLGVTPPDRNAGDGAGGGPP